MTYGEAFKIVAAYAADKGMVLAVERQDYCVWGIEFTEYYLAIGDFEAVYFYHNSLETETSKFNFIMPETEEEFMTLMKILDK